MDQLLIGGRTCRLFGSDRPACILIQPSARQEVWNDILSYLAPAK